MPHVKKTPPAPLHSSGSSDSLLHQRVGWGGGNAIELKTLHPDATFLRILGVNYIHVKTADGGDLYLTEYGVPYIRHVRPQNWYETTWFEQKRQRLLGTGTVYRIPTKPVIGHQTPSIDLAVKWSRVGQDVPLDTFTLYRNINAEFNTPFEEFALLEELRRGEYGPRTLHIYTQKPLAIYVPSERMQPWQTGRSREKIMARVTRRPGVEIDILRSYILIYGWIDGIDAVEAYAQSSLSPAEQEGMLVGLTYSVNLELKRKGFMVADHKPTHIIVRTENGKIVERRDGRFAYAIVDYELLARTEEHENSVRMVRRSEYLVRQRDRLTPRPEASFPTHLKHAKVLGVDYVYGHSESTRGLVWAVGWDPELFQYFLPERWRFKQVGLSDPASPGGGGLVFYVQTKDRVHLVWRVSRVGDVPVLSPSSTQTTEQALQEYGYNSPFEEFALALEMQQRGVRTTYPRAIYMTGGLGELVSPVRDDRRFKQMSAILSPDGKPVLPRDHDYITIWGYWRGCEDDHAVQDDLLWTPLDVSQALAKKMISVALHDEIIHRHAQALARAGFVDLNLKADHILLSYIPDGPIKIREDGYPETRQCNFELVRRIAG
ncbi:MAG: hypothetical protein WCI73_12825 [Phycisphaerae bacterium]